jgi:hypothetical protein
VHFARALPHLTWWPSDRPEYLVNLQRRIARSLLPNLKPPRALDVEDRAASLPAVNAVFSANTLHIMSWPQAQSFFACVQRALQAAPSEARWQLLIYGPFRYGGQFTSRSNEEFDRSLRDRDPASGIRDFEAVQELATGVGLRLVADHPMPANNQLLQFGKGSDLFSSRK